MSSVEKNRKSKGKNYWRSLNELKQTPEFEQFLHREFPTGASEMNNDWSRRSFLTLMGASLALAGLAGCRRPEQKIVPYVKAPEEIVPGKPKYYATSMPFGVGAYGLVVETHEGRPTKVEGNELHPSTLGSSNALIQASILGLYDPDRSQRVTEKGVERSYDEFVSWWRQRLPELKRNRGAGLAVLTGSFASPTLARLRRRFEREFPQASWAAYDPISDENIHAGIKMATGEAYQPVYHYREADVILSLDSDFTLTESENIAGARGFADGRRVVTEKDGMNRLYVVEAGFSVTGAAADHRLRLPTSAITAFAATLFNELRTQDADLSELDNTFTDLPEQAVSWLQPLAKDLLRAKGKSLVVAGRRQPAAVHALVCAINAALGNVGTTVTYRELQDAIVSDRAGLSELARKIDSGRVDTLIMLGGNPAYDAPADLEFAGLLERVTAVHLSLYNDETSRLADWHIPQAHYLESWSDVRAVDGTPGVVQPMIAPLFDGISEVELLSLIVTGEKGRGYDLVRETWKGLLPKGSYEKSWRKVLHDGLLTDSATRTVTPRINPGRAVEAMRQTLRGAQSNANELEIVFEVSPSVYDGRFANNGWLQELPDAITKIAWDNVARISPGTAARLGAANEGMVRIELNGRAVEMPIWIVPGMADNCVALELGYGREGIGRVADGVGFYAYPLRTSSGFDIAVGATITPLGRAYELANAQDHGSMESRPIVREATLGEYREEPNFAPEMVEHPPLVSMFKDHKYDEGYQWGMAIDLTACTGCNACTIACQSENNIPIVGKEQVRNGREMHWIRLDRYYTGDVENPQMVHQPVACQHCEMAPCEQVCPVAATVHDDEGLNVMVYNRCIGTRYCSNNCPYKARRFNFFNFTKDTPEVVKMAQNPDVTVRSRGVMEKCTYCLQRINRARIAAKKENRTIHDGEVVAACQQACPTQAIAFGDINDPESRVSKVKQRNRNYDLLSEINTRPRTSFMAKIRNPNPEMPGEHKA